MSLFPTSLATFTGFTSSHTLSQDSHASQHNSEQAEIIATQTKIGTGSSTPTSGMLLRGTGAGTSSWAQVVLTSDVTGTLPQANGGTGTTLATGTGKVVYDTSPTIASPTLTTPTIASFSNANHSHTNSAGGGTLTGSSLQSNTVTYAQFALGPVVQVVGNVTGAVAAGTTVIPRDDTIPQSNEGDQYLTQSITPKASSNTLVIDVTLQASYSVIADVYATLFQDSGSSAIAASNSRVEVNTGRTVLRLQHIMSAGTTASTTFNVRAGSNTAGTFTLNGASSARIFGGAMTSGITIWEFNS